MLKEQDARYSDLEKAAEISRRIFGEFNANKETNSSGYISFSAASVIPVITRVAPPATTLVATPMTSARDEKATMDITSLGMPDVATWKDDLWGGLVKWCVSDLQVASAFVVNDQALIVARAGGLSADEAEVVGARLLVIFEQSLRIDSDSTDTISMSLEFGNKMIIGIPVTENDRDTILIGMISSNPIGGIARQMIVDAALDVINSNDRKLPVNSVETKTKSIYKSPAAKDYPK